MSEWLPGWRPSQAERYLDILESMHPDPVLQGRIDDKRADLRGEHGPTAEAVIAAELVACTLGARRRPELVKPLLASGGPVFAEQWARIGERVRAAGAEFEQAVRQVKVTMQVKPLRPADVERLEARLRAMGAAAHRPAR